MRKNLLNYLLFLNYLIFRIFPVYTEIIQERENVYMDIFYI